MSLRRPWAVVFVASLLLAACSVNVSVTPNQPDASVAPDRPDESVTADRPDTADVPVIPDVPVTTDRLVADVAGHCFEIGPYVVPATATSQQPPGHTNPVSATMTIPVGQTAYLSVRYYNFCNDPDPRVLAVELQGPDGTAIDPSFTYSGLAVPGYVITQGEPETFRVTFRPTAPGPKTAVVRLRFAHGYYQTTLNAAATSP